MKKIFFAVILSLVFLNFSYSQNTDSLKLRKLSLQFQVGSNFTFSSFQDFMLSFRYSFNRNLSIRTGFGLNFRNTTGNTKYTDPNISYDGDYTNRNEYYVLMINFIYHFNMKGYIKPYIGLGPKTAYDFSKYRTPENENGYRINSSKDWSGGINGLVGVEWFAAEQLSFFGEYSASIMFGNQRREYLNKEITNDYYRLEDYSYVLFQRDIVRLGLSVYF